MTDIGPGAAAVVVGRASPPWFLEPLERTRLILQPKFMRRALNATKLDRVGEVIKKTLPFELHCEPDIFCEVENAVTP